MEDIPVIEPKQQIVLKKTLKRFSKKSVLFGFIPALLIIGSAAVIIAATHSKTAPVPSNNVFQILPTPTSILSSPTPKKDEPFGMYVSPTIPKRDVYIIFMVGDSMTEALGPHGGKLNEFINTLYASTPGHQRVVIDNYAKGSTSLLGLQDVINTKLVVGDAVLDPLLSRRFDLILVESFGYNPLSQLGIPDGLKKQTQTLDQLMKTLTTTHPESRIVFVATIAPNKETYGENESVGNTLAQRTDQAQERMDYINNHMAYARAHNIPLIDIYDKTLTPEGDGNLLYINPNDHIHPSFVGRDFISQEIANFIFDNQIFPK